MYTYSGRQGQSLSDKRIIDHLNPTQAGISPVQEDTMNLGQGLKYGIKFGYFRKETQPS